MREPDPPISSTSHPEVVRSIQILRGVAAVLVVLFHYSHYLGRLVPGVNVGYRLFGGGYVGVDIFFIISGFIIVHSTENPDQSRAVDFAIRRFFRVVPLAQAATLLYALIISSKPTLRLLLRSLCFLPSMDADPPKFGLPVVPQEWTITYELVFYGIFACVLGLTHRLRVVLAAIAILASVVGFQLALGGPVSLRPNGVFLPVAFQGLVSPELLGVLGNPILLDFIAGMLVAVAFRRQEAWTPTARQSRGILWAGITLVGLFVFAYFSPPRPGNGLLDKGSGALCLVAGGLLLDMVWRRRVGPRDNGRCLGFLMWLGAISYPLYLVHLGIAERLVRFIASFIFGYRIDGLAAFLGCMATSFVLAWVAHEFPEKWLTGIGKRLVSVKSSGVATAGVAG